MERVCLTVDTVFLLANQAVEIPDAGLKDHSEVAVRGQAVLDVPLLIQSHAQRPLKIQFVLLLIKNLPYIVLKALLLAIYLRAA